MYEYHQHRFKNKEQAKTEQNVSNGMERINTLAYHNQLDQTSARFASFPTGFIQKHFLQRKQTKLNISDGMTFLYIFANKTKQADEYSYPEQSTQLEVVDLKHYFH